MTTRKRIQQPRLSSHVIFTEPQHVKHKIPRKPVRNGRSDRGEASRIHDGVFAKMARRVFRLMRSLVVLVASAPALAGKASESLVENRARNKHQPVRSVTSSSFCCNLVPASSLPGFTCTSVIFSTVDGSACRWLVRRDTGGSSRFRSAVYALLVPGERVLALVGPDVSPRNRLPRNGKR